MILYHVDLCGFQEVGDVQQEEYAMFLFNAGSYNVQQFGDVQQKVCAM